MIRARVIKDADASFLSSLDNLSSLPGSKAADGTALETDDFASTLGYLIGPSSQEPTDTNSDSSVRTKSASQKNETRQESSLTPTISGANRTSNVLSYRVQSSSERQSEASFYSENRSKDVIPHVGSNWTYEPFFSRATSDASSTESNNLRPPFENAARPTEPNRDEKNDPVEITSVASASSTLSRSPVGTGATHPRSESALLSTKLPVKAPTIPPITSSRPQNDQGSTSLSYPGSVAVPVGASLGSPWSPNRYEVISSHHEKASSTPEPPGKPAAIVTSPSSTSSDNGLWTPSLQIVAGTIDSTDLMATVTSSLKRSGYLPYETTATASSQRPSAPDWSQVRNEPHLSSEQPNSYGLAVAKESSVRESFVASTSKILLPTSSTPIEASVPSSNASSHGLAIVSVRPPMLRRSDATKLIGIEESGGTKPSKTVRISEKVAAADSSSSTSGFLKHDEIATPTLPVAGQNEQTGKSARPNALAISTKTPQSLDVRGLVVRAIGSHSTFSAADATGVQTGSELALVATRTQISTPIISAAASSKHYDRNGASSVNPHAEAAQAPAAFVEHSADITQKASIPIVSVESVGSAPKQDQNPSKDPAALASRHQKESAFSFEWTKVADTDSSSYDFLLPHAPFVATGSPSVRDKQERTGETPKAALGSLSDGAATASSSRVVTRRKDSANDTFNSRKIDTFSSSEATSTEEGLHLSVPLSDPGLTSPEVILGANGAAKGVSEITKLADSTVEGQRYLSLKVEAVGYRSPAANTSESHAHTGVQTAWNALRTNQTTDTNSTTSPKAQDIYAAAQSDADNIHDNEQSYLSEDTDSSTLRHSRMPDKGSGVSKSENDHYTALVRSSSEGQATSKPANVNRELLSAEYPRPQTAESSVRDVVSGKVVARTPSAGVEWPTEVGLKPSMVGSARGSIAIETKLVSSPTSESASRKFDNSSASNLRDRLIDASMSSVDKNQPVSVPSSSNNKSASQSIAPDRKDREPTSFEHDADLTVPIFTTTGRTPQVSSPVASISDSANLTEAPVPAPLPAFSELAQLHQAESTRKPISLASFDTNQSVSNVAPSARVVESQPLRGIQQTIFASAISRTANLTVQLNEGQTAHATVRERAGSVDVKIVTSSSTTAQRISSEIDSMRQNFDAAGLKLGHSEVSYESESGGGRGEYQPDHQENPSSKEIFTLNEVVE